MGLQPEAGTAATVVDAAVSDAASSDASVQHPRPEAGPSGSGQCVQALGEALPARIDVMTAVASSPGSSGAVKPASNDRTVTVAQIYSKLWPHCSGCHGAGQNGFFLDSKNNGTDLALPGGEGFPSKGEEALHHIESDGTTLGSPDEAMPPINGSSNCDNLGWTKHLQQCAGDSLVEVVGLLHAWIDAGKQDRFTIAMPGSAVASDAAAGGGGDAQAGPPPGYALTPAVGNGMTNLGNCIPDCTDSASCQAIVATEQAKSVALDAMFAGLKRVAFGEGTNADVIGLPEKLSDTDLTTWDGEALAREGVIGFVPQYPLWSEDAGKIRFVRVPRGQSIHFNKAKQEFEIPPNTRFYKTFLKQIVDTDGNPSWRKIETRLIVARPDTTATAPDGTTVIVQNALYGSYLWNEQETDAVLLGTGHAPHDLVITGDDLLKDKEGFTDTVLQYETNAVTHTPLRHYAVPSSTRCVQCHQGSPSQDFILGFRPVQLVHRPVGEGGVIEPSGQDEMTLLQRLIDYGIVTGIDSIASDVLPLELSEGDRKPRNDKELTAQGYMVGNCAHCHNPRGFPSITFPILRDVLSFLPGPGPIDGIFQFPLEAVSPRIFRGFRADVLIPYITPSLVDNPSFPPTLDPNSGDEKLISQGGIWRPKWVTGTAQPVYAPWRSLIFRNVDTPFTYTDDFAIYPHMPVNTPGYDPRAKQILGDWMVSIPAIRKRPELDEYVQPYDLSVGAHCVNGDVAECLANAHPASDASPQPYVEVKPGEPGYDAAFAAAQQRLLAFQSGVRPGESLDQSQNRYWNFSPLPPAHSIPDTSDIVDPNVDPVCQPVPDESEQPVLGVPTHPHWVPIDLTQSTGAWVPRGSTWKKVFETKVDDPPKSVCASSPNAVPPAAISAHEQCVVDMLKGHAGCAADQDGVTLDTGFRTFAKTPTPMGLWQEKPACDWAQEPLKSLGHTIAEVNAAGSHPHWLDAPGTDGSRHVYKQTPGEAVFGMICINCHGAQADSKGRLADNLATMTGGNALVADLRDGFFGPSSSPGTNRAQEFMPLFDAGEAADDTAARYMVWMALGGTKVTIPPAFLTIIGQTPVFGTSREGGLAPPTSANMLSFARNMCMIALSTPPFKLGKPLQNGQPPFSALYYSRPARATNDAPNPLIFENGDAELWLRLCSWNNPPPIVPYSYHGLHPDKAAGAAADWKPQDWTTLTGAAPPHDLVTNLYPPPVLRRCAFEGGCPLDDGGQTKPLMYTGVGDEMGNTHLTLTDDNLHPWCLVPVANRPADLPQCDASPGDGNYDDGTVAELWAQRGAINAGLAVFLYLDSITKKDPVTGKHPYAIQQAYNQCDQVK